MHYSGSLNNCYLHARERGGKYDETFKIIQFPWILSVSVFDDDPQKTRRLRPLLVNNQQGQTILNLAFEDPGIYVYTVYMYILNIYIYILGHYHYFPMGFAMAMAIAQTRLGALEGDAAGDDASLASL